MFVSNETDDLNLSVFNMFTGINWSKTLTKYISCKCQYKFDGTKSNSKEMWIKGKFPYECKNPKEHHLCEKFCIWNVTTCHWENGKYLANIIEDSAIKCDEVIETTKKKIQQTLIEKSRHVKQRNSIFHLSFYQLP